MFSSEPALAASYRQLLKGVHDYGVVSMRINIIYAMDLL